MKRFYTLFALLLLTGILLSSCGITIEKRQHTKGYYVHTNARKHSATAHSSKEVPEAVTAAQAESSAASKNVPAEAPQPAALAVVPTEETAIRPADAVSEERTAMVEQRHVGGEITNNTPATEIKDRISWKEKMHTGLKKMKSSSAASDSEALSLFWIVILVLLVLWALGLIGGWGPGGLIYILLVVALILLILWLLRIV
jgi:hypothetical protein